MTLTRDFLLGVFPVTQGQYRRLMGNAAAPYFDGNDAVPMENVTWFDAIHFCNALSEVEGLRPYYRIDGDRVTCHGGTRVPPADRGPVGVCLPRGMFGTLQLRRRPRAAASARLVPGELATTRSSRSDTGRPTGSVSTTCTGTSGNGAGTGTARTSRPPASIPAVRSGARCGCSAAAPGRPVAQPLLFGSPLVGAERHRHDRLEIRLPRGTGSPRRRMMQSNPESFSPAHSDSPDPGVVGRTYPVGSGRQSWIVVPTTEGREWK